MFWHLLDINAVVQIVLHSSCSFLDAFQHMSKCVVRFSPLFLIYIKNIKKKHKKHTHTLNIRMGSFIESETYLLMVFCGFFFPPQRVFLIILIGMATTSNTIDNVMALNISKASQFVWLAIHHSSVSDGGSLLGWCHCHSIIKMSKEKMTHTKRIPVNHLTRMPCSKR